MGRRRNDAPRLEDLLPVVVAEYRAGKSLREIAAPSARQISAATVKVLLDRAGEPIRSTGEGTRLRIQQKGRPLKHDIPEEGLRRLFLDELWATWRIAKHFGVSTEVVVDRIKRYGLARTPEQERRASQVTNDIRKATNTERFGGVSPNHNPDVRARTAVTNQERYGSPNPFGSDQIRQKIAESNLAKYGVANPIQSEVVKDKRRVTNLAKYGVEYGLQAPDVIAKRRATYQNPEYRLAKREGWLAAQQQHWTESTQQVLSCPESLSEYLDETGLRKVQGIADDLGVSYSTAQWRLHRYGLWHRVEDRNTSTYEVELQNYLADRGIKTFKTRGVIFPREIDLYSPDHKIGIEFNGNWAHCELQPKITETYHQTKSLEAQANKGVFIYHVFEYEWLNKRQRPIIEAQLDHLFGLTTKSVGARKCEIVRPSKREANDFLNKHHLQGAEYRSTVVRLGLCYAGELVSVMTFGPPRQDKDAQWEIVRLGAKCGLHVQGGPRRMFERFVGLYRPESIMTYSDLAKGQGKIYANQLGFVPRPVGHITRPSWVWTDGSARPVLSRMSTQSHQVRQRFAGQIEDVGAKSAEAIMHELGYYRIWDCGNRVWVWRPSA